MNWSHMIRTKTIRQTVTFKADPHEVYEALMDSDKHSKFTDSKAIISRITGGEFSVYDGAINGINLELVKDNKIVQSWRSEEDEWPKGHYSKATFFLEKNTTGTLLKFVQTGVPEAAYDSIKDGWREYYWKPMRDMLEIRKKVS